MAKGDSSGGSGITSGTATGGSIGQPPKQDQYSVMHKIFDHISPQKNSGINYNPSQGMGGSLGPQMNMGMQPPNGMSGGNYGGMAPSMESIGPMMGGLFGGQPGYDFTKDIANGGYTGMANQSGSMAPDIQQILGALLQTKPVNRIM